MLFRTMAKCSQCGEDHAHLDPVFARPDDYVALPEDLRREHAQADDDLCRISLPEVDVRHFVRCVLPVAVEGRADGVAWGLWAEVSDDDFRRVLQLWSDEDQAAEPPFVGTIANDVPGMATAGLPVQVRLTGPTSRPELAFEENVDHPFARECRDGVSLARADEWVGAMVHDNPFRIAHLAAIVCQHVFDGGDVLYVTHDREDGAWQLLCGGPHGESQDDRPRLVGVGHLVARDPTLLELGARMRLGDEAERDRVGDPWRIGVREP